MDGRKTIFALDQVLTKMKNRKKTTLPIKYERGFLSKMDGRTTIAQELKSAYAEITDDLGGVDTLSHVKRALAEKFCWLEAILRGVELQIAESDKTEAAELLGRWIQGLNSLTGLAKTLGLKRETRKVDLRSYVEGKRK